MLLICTASFFTSSFLLFSSLVWKADSAATAAATSGGTAGGSRPLELLEGRLGRAEDGTEREAAWRASVAAAARAWDGRIHCLEDGVVVEGRSAPVLLGGPPEEDCWVPCKGGPGAGEEGSWGC